MRDADHFGDRHARAEHIRHMGDGDDLRALRQRALEGLQRERAVIVALDPLDHRALAFAMEMPGHDIGMMLHDRQDDLVVLAYMVEPEGRGDEIDRLRRGTREHDLVCRRRIEETPHAFARAFESFRRGIGEIMQPAMHVGIFVFVGVAHTIEHLTRLLRRGCIVEIDERLAVRLLVQDREILAKPRDVEGNVQVHRGCAPPRRASHAPRSASSASRRRSFSTFSTASAPNASTSRLSASMRGIPRAIR